MKNSFIWAMCIAIYPGQYYDEETGLHFNWNRYYDPEIGRYIRTDPIGLNGGLNLYAYVNGNPVRYYDEKGLAVAGGAISIPLICITRTIIVWIAGKAVVETVKICKPPKDECEDEDDGCDKIVNECREGCIKVYADDPGSLPGTGSDMKGRIRLCTRICAESYGCYNY